MLAASEMLSFWDAYLAGSDAGAPTGASTAA